MKGRTVFILFLLALGPSLWAQEVAVKGTISVDSLTADPGAVVDLQVRISPEVGKITGVDFTIDWVQRTPSDAPLLEAVKKAESPDEGEVKPGAVWGSTPPLAVANATDPQRVRVLMTTIGVSEAGGGVLALVKVKVPESALPGAKYTLNLSNVTFLAEDGATQFTAKTEPGVLEVKGAPPTPPPVSPPPKVENAINLGNHVVVKGQPEARIRLILMNPTAVAGVQIRILYDPKVVQPIVNKKDFADSVIAGGIGDANFETEAPPDAKGLKGITIAYASTTGAQKTGKLFDLFFKAVDTAPNFATSPLLVDLTQFQMVSEDPNKTIEGTVFNGSVTVVDRAGGSVQIAGVTPPPQVKTPLLGSVSGSVTVATLSDQLKVALVVDDSGNLLGYSLPLTNESAPLFVADVGGSVSGRPVFKEGSIYIATDNGLVSKWTLSPDGKQIQSAWPNPANLGTTLLGSTPAVLGGFVYVADGQGNIRALSDADGKEVRSFRPPGAGGFISSPSANPNPDGTTGNLWIGSVNSADPTKGSILRLKPDLTVDIAFDVGGAVTSSPFSLGNTVFVGAKDGVVYQYQITPPKELGKSANLGAPVLGSLFVVAKPGLLEPDVVVAVTAQGEAYVLNGTDLTKVRAMTLGPTTEKQSPIVVSRLQGAPYLYVADTQGELHILNVTHFDDHVGIPLGTPATSLSVSGFGDNDVIVVATTRGSLLSLPLR